MNNYNINDSEAYSDAIWDSFLVVGIWDSFLVVGILVFLIYKATK